MSARDERTGANQDEICVGLVLAGTTGVQIQSYRDLEAWQLGIQFVISIYNLTKRFPPEERYRITSQLRRAAVSIPSNLSEGQQRGLRSYGYFVGLALGSLAEADTQLEIATRLDYATASEMEQVVAQCGRLRQVLHGLRRALAARQRAHEV